MLTVQYKIEKFGMVRSSGTKMKMFGVVHSSGTKMKMFGVVRRSGTNTHRRYMHFKPSKSSSE